MKDNFKKYYIQTHFLICVAALAMGGGMMSFMKSYLNVQMIKKALPLRKILDLINEKDLGAYTVAQKQKIKNQDLLDALGTNEYIQWILEDTEAKKTGPLRYCSLFITYYTGNPDRIPHVPEECFFGGGNQRFEMKDITFTINQEAEHGTGIKMQENKIPARYIIFGKKEADLWQGSDKFPVFYTFKVNGTYKGNRTGARLALMSNIRGKYSYFSKIEWQFYNVVLGRKIYPEKEDAIVASKKFLSVILSILERDHWPDWQKAMQKG